MRRFRFAATIKGKILIYTGSIAFLTLSVLIFLQTGDMYERLMTDSRHTIQVNNNKAAAEIEKGNQSAVTWPKSMAFAQVHGLFGKREATMGYVRDVLSANAAFFDAYTIYEPNADGQDQANAGKPGSDARGRFGAVLNNVNGRFEWALPVNMETSLYYQGCKEKFLSGAKDLTMVTEPYLYEGVLMVEQTYPIVIDGRFKGVTGVDRTLDFILEDLRKIKPCRSAEFFLVSQRGAVIAATPDPELHTRKIDETPYREILRRCIDSRASNGVHTVSDPSDGETYLYTGCPVKTGDWTLVMRVAEREITEPVLATLRRSLLVSALGVLLTFLGLYIIGNSIARPLKSTVETARQIAAGDLTVRLNSAAGGEVGHLIEAMQGMTASLNKVLTQVQNAGRQVGSAARQIDEAAVTLQATVGEQAASTGQTRLAVEEIFATSDRLAHTMGEVTTVAAGTVELADEGGKRLEAMEARMRELSEGALTISSRLTAIRTKTSKIGKILTAITRVADQTNMLSLNAAIEAEKAGDAGLGFGVVAREIRLLADQTAESAQDIEQMITDMQDAVSAGVSGMDNFAAMVRSGIEEVERLGAQMERILAQVRDLLPRFVTVDEGMQSQSESARQIRDLVGCLSDATRHTAGSAAGLNQAATSLQSALRDLDDEVARFKL
ncbi:MAG: methyl-accepting chemotaxis protein [Acidobacteria bacterium]|nr:methyl-accepting chemotaxis protein [Acidobacteriota bacterium]